MNACNIALITSITESSPQFIKEVTACNVPIVSPYVGYVKIIISNTEGCFNCLFESADIPEKINKSVLTNNGASGRNDIKIYMKVNNFTT